MSEPVLEPDVPEVLQEEAPYTLTAVPVEVECVKSPVRVQTLPRKGAATFTKTVGTQPVRLLTADHRRGRTVLIGLDPFLVGFSEASCQAESSMASWPADIPLELTATSEVWAMVPVGTASISVLAERWAEG